MFNFSSKSLQSILRCWFFFISSSICASFLFYVSLLYIYSFYTFDLSLLYFITFSWHLLSICWFWSLSFVTFYSRDFTFCSWLFAKVYFYLRFFYLSSWMDDLRDSLSFKCYAVFSLRSLHSLSSFLASFLESANYDSMARIFSLHFSKSIDCKFYKSAILCSFCCI